MLANYRISKLKGTINAPPSKSLAHRLLIAAAISGKPCTVANLAYSQDILATIDCLRAMSAHIELIGDKALIDGRDFLSNIEELLCRESGSTLRFMIPLACLSGQEVKLSGSERLLMRPLDVYEELGFRLRKDGEHLFAKGELTKDEYVLRGNVSSQFISGLMFALAYKNKDARIIVSENFESRSYVLLTIAALNSFGYQIKIIDNIISLKQSDMVHGGDFRVEADESNAAFLACYKNVKVIGCNPNTLQGDAVFRDMFKKLKKGYCEIDIADCPDLGPILMAYAAAHYGCHLLNTGRLALKESDRGQAMAMELAKMNIETGVLANDIYVEPGELKCCSLINSHNDHRIVMAMSYLLFKTGGSLEGYEAVNKSFPDYFECIKALGGEVDLNAG